MLIDNDLSGYFFWGFSLFFLEKIWFFGLFFLGELVFETNERADYSSPIKAKLENH